MTILPLLSRHPLGHVRRHSGYAGQDWSGHTATYPEGGAVPTLDTPRYMGLGSWRPPSRSPSLAATTLSPSLLLRSLSLWPREDGNENLYKIHRQVTSSRCTRTLEHGTWGLKKESRPTLDSGRLDHGLPLLVFFLRTANVCSCVSRSAVSDLCVSADSYPSACQPVSKLVVHTYIYLMSSPFLSRMG